MLCGGCSCKCAWRMERISVASVLRYRSMSVIRCKLEEVYYTAFWCPFRTALVRRGAKAPAPRRRSQARHHRGLRASSAQLDGLPSFIPRARILRPGSRRKQAPHPRVGAAAAASSEAPSVLDIEPCAFGIEVRPSISKLDLRYRTYYVMSNFNSSILMLNILHSIFNLYLRY